MHIKGADAHTKFTNLAVKKLQIFTIKDIETPMYHGHGIHTQTDTHSFSTATRKKKCSGQSLPKDHSDYLQQRFLIKHVATQNNLVTAAPKKLSDTTSLQLCMQGILENTSELFKLSLGPIKKWLKEAETMYYSITPSIKHFINSHKLMEIP